MFQNMPTGSIVTLTVFVPYYFEARIDVVGATIGAVNQALYI
jgi:hypothetical protein